MIHHRGHMLMERWVRIKTPNCSAQILIPVETPQVARVFMLARLERNVTLVEPLGDLARTDITRLLEMKRTGWTATRRWVKVGGGYLVS